MPPNSGPTFDVRIGPWQMPAAQPEADAFCSGQVPAANTNIPDRTHQSGTALTAVPLLFALCHASVARRIYNRLANDIRRGHNSHRQGDLYRAKPGAKEIHLRHHADRK